MTGLTATQGAAVQHRRVMTQHNTIGLHEIPHFGVAVICVPQPGTCSPVPAMGDDLIFRLLVSHTRNAEIQVMSLTQYQCTDLWSV